MRRHQCGWPGCDVKVDGWRWGCSTHFAKLPADQRDRLSKIKHYWPEAKAAREAATKWAARHIREEAAACRVCGGEPSPRLDRYCVPCHIAAVTGDRSEADRVRADLAARSEADKADAWRDRADLA